MVVSILSVLNWKKLLFLANLVQKNAILSLSWKLVLRQFEYEDFNSDVQFLCFWTEVYFFVKFAPKIQIVC